MNGSMDRNPTAPSGIRFPASCRRTCPSSNSIMHSSSRRERFSAGRPNPAARAVPLPASVRGGPFGRGKRAVHDYTGVIHLHSEYSFDGRTPVSRMIRAARTSRVHFLALTDPCLCHRKRQGLGRMARRRPRHRGPGDLSPVQPLSGLWSLRGRRHSRRRGGHGSAKLHRPGPGSGGIGFIAHPDHKGAPLFHVKHYPWTDWDISGFNGLGIWDFMTDWQESLTGKVRALASYLMPALVLRGPDRETLVRWDALGRERRVPGIGECDNHNTKKRWVRCNNAGFSPSPGSCRSCGPTS